ncbi:hypothetical protein Tco_0598257 [Tanacetum coccineum]
MTSVVSRVLPLAPGCVFSRCSSLHKWFVTLEQGCDNSSKKDTHVIDRINYIIPFEQPEQLDQSLVGKIQVCLLLTMGASGTTVKTDMVKHEVEIQTLGECVDEIDKLSKLIDEMQLKQEDQSCVHASNELSLHVFHVVAGKHEADQHLSCASL